MGADEYKLGVHGLQHNRSEDSAKGSKVRVGLVLFDECFGSGAAGVAEMLLAANEISHRQYGCSARGFSWQFLTVTGEPVRSANGLMMTPDAAVGDTVYDLVFISAPFYHGRQAFRSWLQGQKGVTQWLKYQWGSGAVLSTYGLGSFLLADAGLLDDRDATTVWWMESELKRRYPNVRIRNTELMTEQDRIISVGAASSLLYLIIKLIERFISPTVAMQCARATQADVAHALKSPYLNASFEPSADDPLVNAARFRMQQDIGKDLRLAELAASLQVSQSTLIRRFRKTLGVTPQVYSQNIRIEAAKQWLLCTRLPIDEIVERVGYNDPSSFTRLFRQRVGLSPGTFRERFGTLSLN